MKNLNIKIIEENFKEYFDAKWLSNVIENGGYENFGYGHKVAIDLVTNAVWCMQNNEYSQDTDVEYFSLPKYIVDYSNALDGEIENRNCSKNKTLKGYIKDSFDYLGHFCIDDYSDEFYLKDELIELKNINEIKYFNDDEIRIINSSYGTACALKLVLKNIFNADDNPNVDIQKCLLGDEKHRPIFFKILDMPLSYINGRQILEDFF